MIDITLVHAFFYFTSIFFHFSTLRWFPWKIQRNKRKKSVKPDWNSHFTLFYCCLNCMHVVYGMSRQWYGGAQRKLHSPSMVKHFCATHTHRHTNKQDNNRSIIAIIVFYYSSSSCLEMCRHATSCTACCYITTATGWFCTHKEPSSILYSIRVSVIK